MNAGTPPPAAEPAVNTLALAEPPFVLHRPPGALASPLIFASPHSGRIYPADMMAASALDAAAIRRSEDAFVDVLIGGGEAHGAAILAAGYARAYVDVNREPYELDPSMFEDELPDFARGRSARVAAGLGSIARIVAEGQEIYARKLTFDEARRRIEAVHQPYHAMLEALMAEACAQFGQAVLIDWHSMPSAAARTMGQSGDCGRAGVCDLVLGDRFGAACDGQITATVERELEVMGYRVARNAPYAGGFTTEYYGHPRRRRHALQIEINRALYLDEASLQPHAGLERLKSDLQKVFSALTRCCERLA